MDCTVVIAADQGGYTLKNEIVRFLQGKGISCVDFGIHQEESVDYPAYAVRVANEVASGNYTFGILCCGTGIGMSMAANKVRGIRAACCGDDYSAKMTRSHNDANVLCLGGRVLGVDAALSLVKVFLSTPFSKEERHVRRVAQIGEI